MELLLVYKFFKDFLLPSFVLLDKDAGEILAVSEIWWNSNIQLCYWHLENAISKCLKIKSHD